MQTVQSLTLLDPSRCGEDLAYNAQRFGALHRYTGRKIFDRPELIRLAGKIIADKAARPEQTIEIVIAGSADTAMFATSAHVGANPFRRGPHSGKRASA